MSTGTKDIILAESSQFIGQIANNKYPGVFIYKMHFDCAQCSTAALKEG
jgi:hypothetical protein